MTLKLVGGNWRAQGLQRMAEREIERTVEQVAEREQTRGAEERR